MFLRSFTSLPLLEQDQGTGGAPAGTPPEPSGSQQRPPVTPSKVYGSATGEILSGGEGPDDDEGEPQAGAAQGEPPPAAPPPQDDPRFQNRLARERRKWLRDEFGTDDPERVKAIKAERAKQAEEQKRIAEEHKRLKAEEERRKRQTMTEQDRLKADLEREKKRAQEYQAKLQEVQAQQAFTEQNQIIEGLATKHVDPELLEDAMDRFARYVRTLDKKQLAALNDRSIDRWFQKLVADKPKFAKPPEETKPDPAKPDQVPATVTGAAAKPVVQRRVVQTTRKAVGGKPTGKPVPTGGAGKTAKPGTPNTMSKAELAKQYKEKTGRSLPW